MYMYKSMYRAVMLCRNERLADDPDKSLNGYLLPNVIELYGYDVFGVTALFGFHM